MDPLSILGVLSSLAGLFGGGEAPKQVKPSSPPPEIPSGILGVLGGQPPRRSLGVDASLPGAPAPQNPSYPSIGASQSPNPAQQEISRDLSKPVAPKLPGSSPARAGTRAEAEPPTKSSFLGLGSDEWNSIGTATSILAKLFETRQAPQALNPTLPVSSQVPAASLGQGLAGSGRSLSFPTASAPSFPSQEMSKLMRRG